MQSGKTLAALGEGRLDGHVAHPSRTPSEAFWRAACVDSTSQASLTGDATARSASTPISTCSASTLWKPVAAAARPATSQVIPIAVCSVDLVTLMV